jgi:DNA repair protein RadD
MSPGLFAQIVGRGFRVHPTKDTCLILDFGQNINRHGPLDDPDYGLDVRRKGTGEKAGEVPCKECPNCREEILIQARICPFCDFIFTSPEKK